MNLIELHQALKQLRLSGMATVLETRLQQAQAEAMAPIDLISCLVTDELTLRGDRLLERRRKQAGFRDSLKTLDNFDFSFNKKMNRSLLFELASGNFVNRREDVLFLGPPGSGKSHLAQAIGQAVIQQGYRVLYRETHLLLDELTEATAGFAASNSNLGSIFINLSWMEIGSQIRVTRMLKLTAMAM
jgi:DNA replication protein DnaC